MRRRLFSPVTWPVISFLVAIALGALALALPFSHADGEHLGWLDALFLAPSAVCVTGLSTVDISTALSPAGQAVLLLLIQTGGLGVMTYTSLAFLLWRRQVPFTSREAVSQALLGGSFDLRAFLRQITGIVLGIELLAALALHLHDPAFFTPFRALFHAVSAFCNAGFALRPDNLISWQYDVTVNVIISLCVIFGGLGFGVLRELLGLLTRGRLGAPVSRLSRFSRLILRTSLFLVVAGGLLIYVIEWRRPGNEHQVGEGFDLLLTAFFHSVSARTAGFNTVDMAHLSLASLLLIMLLMFIGGGPGSCAGGIKLGTFRVLVGYFLAQFRGNDQIVLGGRGVPLENVKQALTLFFLYCLTIVGSLFLLTLTETGILHRSDAHSGLPFVHLLFEVVSALGTVGLSVNVTPQLTAEGKLIIIFNMFAGRVGLLSLLLAIRSLRRRRSYAYAEAQMPIG